MNLVLRTAL